MGCPPIVVTDAGPAQEWGNWFVPTVDAHTAGDAGVRYRQTFQLTTDSAANATAFEHAAARLPVLAEQAAAFLQMAQWFPSKPSGQGEPANRCQEILEHGWFSSKVRWQ